MAADGKTVTIQHLSSDQANLGSTENDSSLPSSSGGGGIGAWISSHKMMLLIIGGGAIVGLIVFFYIKNNQNQQPTPQDGAQDDTSTSSSDGTSTGTTSGVDFSPIEDLLNQQQKDLDTLLNDESGEQGTPPSSGNCPKGMHKTKSGRCACNGKNMVNKGTHCEKKKGGKGSETPFALGGSFDIASTPMFQDMNVGYSNPYRNTGHRMYYALGGSNEVYHGSEETAKGRKYVPSNYTISGGIHQIGREHSVDRGRGIMPPSPFDGKYHHW